MTYSDHTIAQRSLIFSAYCSSRCRCYVDELLGVDRFFEILGIVEHRQIECGESLPKCKSFCNFRLYNCSWLCKLLTRCAFRCLHFMDQNAAALTKHASFLDISHERLMKILARNSINIHEIDLYRAA